MIHELTAAECRGALGRAHHGKLGCARADQPYIVPFSFYFDPREDCLYSFSALGQKIDWMRGNPKVCVEVDDIVDQFNWTTVIALGRYEEVSDSRTDTDARRRAYELFQQRSAWWLPGVAKLASGEEHPTPVIYRIRLERVTGRRAAPPPPNTSPNPPLKGA
ncbi:MAG TPA: pyridoxamine 5'-phosphate oxidase family protein [Vicinamibacterales bacterium]|nr:pyridoxamine 5'-phosphate oxidase family protein [Vicinamibacterales bacterium]